MNARVYIAVRICAIAATLALLVAEHYAPAKQRVIFPSPDVTLTLFTDQSSGGHSRAEWISRSLAHWRCEIVQSDVYPICGLSVEFSAPPYRSLDLSSFQTLELQLDYAGKAKVIRLYMRNHDPAYSSPLHIASTKFESVVLRTSDLHGKTAVGLSEFSVADWWKGYYEIPREHSQPDFKSVVAIGIDQAGQPVYGEHTYQLKSLVLKGDWIKPEDLYLLLIAGWMFVIGWEAVSRILYLLHKTRLDSIALHQLREESAQYKKLSTTDALTGVINRAGLDAIIHALTLEPGQLCGMAVLVLDIDHFKRINDSRGHDVGDRILFEFARKIKACIRADDIFARWGGEEFIVLARLGDHASVQTLAEKIRTAVYHSTFEPSHPVKLTVSIGAARITADEAFEQAFRRADQLLYQAKNLGRNCVVVEAPEPD